MPLEKPVKEIRLFNPPPLRSVDSIKIRIKPPPAGRKAKLVTSWRWLERDELMSRAEETRAMLAHLLDRDSQELARYIRCPLIEIDPATDSSNSFPYLSVTVQYSL